MVYFDEKACEIPGGVVVMPLEYWLALGRYAVDMERARGQVEAMYGGGGK